MFNLLRSLDTHQIRNSYNKNYLAVLLINNSDLNTIPNTIL